MPNEQTPTTLEDLKKEHAHDYIMLSDGGTLPVNEFIDKFAVAIRSLIKSDLIANTNSGVIQDKWKVFPLGTNEC